MKTTKCKSCGRTINFSSKSAGLIENCPYCGKFVSLHECINNPDPEFEWQPTFLKTEKLSIQDFWKVVGISFGIVAGIALLLTLLVFLWKSQAVANGLQSTGTFVWNTGVLLAAGIIFLLIYFLPTIIAAKNQNKDVSAIFIINLLLGWTFLGWVIALAWAFKV